MKERVVNRIIERLESTYSDFIEGVKGFDQIVWFFREHLYTPPNKEARDEALDSLYIKLKSVTGPEMTEKIHMLIELNKMTDRLDLETARDLLAGPYSDIDSEEKLAETEITEEEIHIAFIKSGQLDDREKQIDMICDTLSFFFTLSKLPLIKLVMAPIRVAASLVGAQELVGTMEAGYALSKGIKDMDPFIEAFRKREKELISHLKEKASA